MKSIKKVLSVILALSLSLALTACMGNGTSTKSAQPIELETTKSSFKGETIKIGTIAGSSEMGMLTLTEDKIFDISRVDDSSKLSELLFSGKIDIAACSLNTAAELFNKNENGIRMLGIIGISDILVVSTIAEAKSLSDLDGKTVCVPGKGSSNEIALSYALSQNGLSEKVRIESSASEEEILEKLIAGEIETAVLSEPYATAASNAISKKAKDEGKNISANTLANLNDEWAKATPDAKLASSCVITTADFAESNKKAVSQFLASVRDSVEIINRDPVNMLKTCIEKKIIPESVLSSDDKKADSINGATVESCGIVFIEGNEMQKIADAFFSVLADFDADSIGGKLPESGIYFSAE